MNKIKNFILLISLTLSYVPSVHSNNDESKIEIAPDEQMIDRSPCPEPGTIFDEETSSCIFPKEAS